MRRANFCVECGERLAREGWRARVNGRFCLACAQRLGKAAAWRPLILVVVMAVTAFALGRYLRPPAPPLIIQRAANSPLRDSPVEFTSAPHPASPNGSANANQSAGVASEEGYICGARTQKGTPCRRRVHVAGERCFQHKGLAAMLPLEKLVIKPSNAPK